MIYYTHLLFQLFARILFFYCGITRQEMIQVIHLWPICKMHQYLLVILETSRKDRDIIMSENHVILFTIVLTKGTTICQQQHQEYNICSITSNRKIDQLSIRQLLSARIRRFFSLTSLCYNRQSRDVGHVVLQYYGGIIPRPPHMEKLLYLGYFNYPSFSGLRLMFFIQYFVSRIRHLALLFSQSFCPKCKVFQQSLQKSSSVFINQFTI